MPQRLLALGFLGLSHAETLAEMGITDQQYDEWRGRHVEFAIAASRARGLAMAAWDRKARQSISSGSWRFPIHQLEKIKSSLFPEEKQQVDDMSRLVRIDGVRPASAGKTER